MKPSLGGCANGFQVKGKNMKIQRAIEINAPPEKIWPFFVEPEKVLQWCITFKKFEYANDQQSGKGTSLYIEEEAGGRLSKMRA